MRNLNIQRCFKPPDFGSVVSAKLHHFSDASLSGYGQCFYLRLIDDKQQVNCSLVMSKSRVAPLKAITIPRYELPAAVVSVKVSDIIQRELNLPAVTNFYWTDSKIVLGYISNDSRRFQIFVANRVQLIHDHTNASEWRYVDTSENPADIASRRASVEQLLNRPDWFHGPSFLKQLDLPTFSDCDKSLPPDDQELKKVKALSTQSNVGSPESNVSEHFSYFSSWTRLRLAICLCLLYIRKLKQRSNVLTLNQSVKRVLPQGNCMSFSVGELEEAELAIIRVVQF